MSYRATDKQLTLLRRLIREVGPWPVFPWQVYNLDFHRLDGITKEYASTVIDGILNWKAMPGTSAEKEAQLAMAKAIGELLRVLGHQSDKVWQNHANRMMTKQ